MRSLATVSEELVAVLRRLHREALAADSPPERVADVVGRWALLKRAIRETDELYRELFVEWLQENGDLEIGDARYYPGIETSESCNDPEEAFESLATEVGGDIETLKRCLSSKPFKVATAAQAVARARAERYADRLEDEELQKWEKKEAAKWRAEHFEKTVRLEPKTGKPKRVPVMVNEKYLTQPGRDGGRTGREVKAQNKEE